MTVDFAQGPAGDTDVTGRVDITGTGNATTIGLNGDTSTISAGTNGANGIISLYDLYSTLWWGILLNSQNRSFTINKVLTPAQQGSYPVVSFHGTTGFGAVGGNGQDGEFGTAW